MKEAEIYRVPPKLNNKYLLAGYTIAELIVVVFASFIGLAAAMQGFGVMLVIPASILVLCFRPRGERTIWQELLLRINYFNNDNIYSLEECRRLWK